jgi:poly-gamma-glutamate synthesis protein (capsule biosynthesis protein)
VAADEDFLDDEEVPEEDLREELDEEIPAAHRRKEKNARTIAKEEPDTKETHASEEEDPFEEDEFERLLREDGQDGLDMEPLLNAVGAAAGKFAGFFQGLGEKLQKAKPVKQKSSERNSEKKKRPEDTEVPAGEDSLEDLEVLTQENAPADMETPMQEDRPADAKTSVQADGSAEEKVTLPEMEDISELVRRDDAGKSAKASGKESLAETAKHEKFEKFPALDTVKNAFADLVENLSQKGIQKRELAMLVMGAVLVVLILAFVISGIRSSVENKAKSKHVTADSGLTVTVEEEPEEWCSSYPITLRVRCSGSTISKVIIGGESYVPDERGQITFEATEDQQQMIVMTEDGERNALVEIPMIDAEAPVVTVSREQDQISVAAADARSSVRGIWYAAVRDDDFIGLPLYQQYTEPFTYEEDTMYYFYAEDYAGNRSDILVTTTQDAQSLSLDTEKLSLFPEETQYLKLETTPAGALVHNLSYESAAPDVVTVDNYGIVTAQKEGSTVITVNADGMAPVSCAVEVSNERTVTISAIGDCTLGTDENFNTSTSFDAYDAVNGHSYFFRNVAEILENDDVTFANFEGTLTTETARESKEYAFKGDPSYTEILESGSIEVVTLANNHSSDYGTQSLVDTKQYLTEAGIDYCDGDEIVLRDVNGIKTAFIGIYVLRDGLERETQVRETIASAQEQGAQLIIIAFHWGTEKATEPDETQQYLAHLAIDCGADLVVGHHPHVLQGIENYNGKYIVYSLGNFCFGGNSSPSDLDTMIFQQTFTVSQEGVKTDNQITIIPCTISSNTGYNNYQPTPAEGSEAERIMDRINEYSSAFGQTYTLSLTQ